MADTFFYYTLSEKSTWLAAPSSQLAHILETKSPLYTTVLHLDRLVEDSDPVEVTSQIKYIGPFYADWDCQEIAEGAASVNRFIDLLIENDVNPSSLKIFATGGRGFHIEVPFETFSSGGKGGTRYLPAIFKEIANDLFTEFLDLCVYSGKRGRQWRSVNVQRANGAYKVPISVQQMRDMTPEVYAELCKQPQPFPELAPPVLSPALAAMFSDHQAKVEQRHREKSKRKNDDGLIKRMNGEWPASVKQIMAGENLDPEIGLNKVALQLGILSNALGKTLDEHLEACSGLIKTHRGDHATRRSVRQELTRMYGYAHGNPAYTYSPAAMAALMLTPQLAKDLRGTAAPAAGTNPEDFGDLSKGIVLGSNGIYSVKEDSLHRETNWHYDAETATQILDAETGNHKGFILHGRDSGKPTQEMNVDHSTFISGDKFKGFLASKGAAAPRMDGIKAGAILAMIMQHARQNGSVFALSKEGFNIVKEQMVWCSPTGCWAHNSEDTFRFRGASGSESGNFQSDVMSAPPLNDFANASAVIDALLNFNLNDFTVAATLGWFISCWHKPLHIAYGHSFPILQAYGESGAGKTLLCMQMLKMFYYHAAPKAMNASQGSSYGRRVMFSGSSTIPVLVDEFKPTKMSLEAVRDFRMTIHEMYTPAFQSPRGGGDARSSAPGNWAELHFETKTTPLCFTTETAESETAIQERTISVPFSKATRAGKADAAFQIMSGNPEVLAALGKLLLLGTAAAKRESLKSLIVRSQEVANETLARSGNSRVVYNAGVALAGLGFFGMVLRHHMPTEYAEKFEARLETLRTSILDPENYTSLVAAPEIVKLLRFMVTISHQDDLDAEWNVRHGIEYAYHGADLDLDLNVDAFYLRYRTAVQRRSQSPAFNDTDAFLAALRSSSLAKESSPPDTPLNKGTNAPRVVRLSAAALEEYGLGAFRV